MKRRTKKLFSLLLSLALVVGMIPAFGVTASAAAAMNPQVNNGIVTWSALDGAAYYEVTWTQANYFDSEDKLTGTSFDVQSEIDFNPQFTSGKCTIYVDAYRSSGVHIKTEQVTFDYVPKVPALDDPANVRFIGTKCQWDPVDGAEHYSFYLYADGQNLVDESVYGTSMDISAYVESDVSYYFVVRAFSSEVKWSHKIYSEIVSGDKLKAGYKTPEKLAGTVIVIADSSPISPGVTLDCAFSGGLAQVPPSKMAFQWQFTRTSGDAIDINGATKRQYTIGDTYGNTSIRVKITAQGYSGEVTSEWVTVDSRACNITVIAGSANKTEAQKDETVVLNAIPKNNDFTFDSWDIVAGGGSVANKTATSTKFTMPGNDVKISGNYKVKSTAGTNSWSGKTNPFVDVSKGTYYYDPVLWAYYASPQVTNGIDTTHFGPMSTVTRGQCVTFLWRAMGCPEPANKTNPFVDVPEKEYYYKPILWAVEKGITKGTDVNHFTPNQKLSTAHIVTFLYRTLEKGTDGWYEEAGNWAKGDGLLDGTGLGVSDQTDCPRGAVVTFLCRELADTVSGANQLSQDDFLIYVEEYYNITGRGRVISGRVVNGSIRTGDKVTLISYDESTKAPVRTTYTVLGIEMFHKTLDEAQKGDNVGLWISSDGSIKTPSGSAIVNEGSALKSSPGRFVGTFKRNSDYASKTLTLGDTFQVYWAGYDVTAMLVNLRGGDITPNTTREDVKLTLMYPAVLYVGQELTIREGGRTYGTFTVTGIE